MVDVTFSHMQILGLSFGRGVGIFIDNNLWREPYRSHSPTGRAVSSDHSKSRNSSQNPHSQQWSSSRTEERWDFRTLRWRGCSLCIEDPLQTCYDKQKLIWRQPLLYYAVITGTQTYLSSGCRTVENRTTGEAGSDKIFPNIFSLIVNLFTIL